MVSRRGNDSVNLDTRGGWIVLLPNFREQVVWLILLPDLDTAIDKYAENNEHKNFYVENLVPNQGKKPWPTTCRISPTTRRTFPLTRANGYNTTHPVTSNSHTNVQHPWTLTHVLVSSKPGQFTQSQKNEFFFLTTNASMINKL